MEIGIHAVNNLNKNQIKSVEQQLEEKISDYLRSSSRNINNKDEFKSAIIQLSSNKIDVKSFCKQILNSTNSNDIEIISNFLDQNNQTEKESINSQSTLKQEQKNIQNPLKNNSNKATENTNTFDQLKIVQTSANDQLLVGEIISMIKKGKINEALDKTSSSNDLIEKILSLIPKTNTLNLVQIQSIIAFINGIIINFAGLNPSLLESLKEKLDKLKKELKNIENKHTTIEEENLSDNAKTFITPFMSIIEHLNQLEGNLPKDISDALSSLLQKLEDSGDGNGKY